MGALFRLRDLLPDPEEDVREELDSHLEMKARALMEEGLGEDEARATARERLGNRPAIEREAIRYATRWHRKRRLWSFLDALFRDLRYGLRALVRARVATPITLLLLALGIGANTALFSVLKGVLLNPLPVPDGEELVFLWEKTLELPRIPASFANYRDWRERSRTLHEMGAYLARPVNLTDGGEPVQVRGALATASLFSVLEATPSLGRTFGPEEDLSGLPVVILDHELWLGRYGGDPEIIGRSVALDGVPHTVVGVMPRGLRQPDPTGLEPVSLWVPLPRGTESEPRQSHSYQVLGRASPGVGLEEIREEMDAVAGALATTYPESNDRSGIQVEAVREVLYGEAGRQVLLVLGAAAMVLLMACGNIASLQLARSATRRGELAIRGALGGSRRRILRQLVMENTLLALAGGGLGLLVAGWTLEILEGLIPPEIPRIQEVRMDGGVLLFALAISLLVGILFGLVPSLRASGANLADTLRQESGRDGMGGRTSRSQTAFLAGQFALCLVLVNAAFLFLQSYRSLRGNEPGFLTADVLTMELSLRGSGYSVVRGRAEFYDELLPRLRGLPGVRAAGAATGLPMMGGAEARVVREEDWTGDPGDVSVLMESERVAGDFFTALGIPLVAGRGFVRGEDDRGLGDTRAILNQTAASALWPREGALGKRFTLAREEPDWITVVGVVADTRNGGVGLDPLPEIYFPYASMPTGRMFLTLRTAGDPLGLSPAVLEEIRKVDPLQAVSRVGTMEGLVRSQLSARAFYTSLVAGFALLAFLMAAAGVFGTLSHYVAGRTREMGVRMALGSGGGGLLRMILIRAGGVAGSGLGIGLLGVYLSRELIRAYVYGVEPLEPATVAWGAASLLAVALLAAAGPARRATRVDPAEALRGE